MMRSLIAVFAAFLLVGLVAGSCTYTVTTNRLADPSDNTIREEITPVESGQKVEDWYNLTNGETSIEELKEAGVAKVLVYNDTTRGKATLVVVQTPKQGQDRLFAMKSTFLEEKFEVKLLDGDRIITQDQPTLRIGGDAVTAFRVRWWSDKNDSDGIGLQMRRPDFCVRTSIQFAASVDKVEFLNGDLTPAALDLDLTEQSLFFDICANCDCRLNGGGNDNDNAGDSSGSNSNSLAAADPVDQDMDEWFQELQDFTGQ